MFFSKMCFGITKVLNDCKWESITYILQSLGKQVRNEVETLNAGIV